MGAKIQYSKQNYGVSNISSYIFWISRIPTLTREAELSLAKKVREVSDRKAIKELAASHMKLVIKISRCYSGYGLPQEDIIQEGSVGLLKAIRKFDPKLGVRLASFAVYWIRSEVREFVIKNWRIIKIATTKSQRKLFFNLKGIYKNKNLFSKREINLISKRLGIGMKQIHNMQQRLTKSDKSFDVKEENNEERNLYSPENFVKSNLLEPQLEVERENWLNYYTKKIYSAINSLDDRSKEILQHRWMEEGRKLTLKQLAIRHNISIERVRQIEKNIISLIRSNIKMK